MIDAIAIEPRRARLTWQCKITAYSNCVLFILIANNSTQP